jgi:hypothetical protein
MKAGANADYEEAHSFVSSFGLKWKVESDICSVSHPIHALEAISLLVGENGVNIERWKTLHISLPTESEALGEDSIWPLFSGPTPNLTKIFIAGVDHTSRNVLDMSAVEDLALSRGISDPKLLKLSRVSLRRLKLECDLRRCGSIHFSWYAHLEHLTITHVTSDCTGRSPRAELGVSAATHIYLPSLQSLSLLWYVNAAITWKLPKLQMFRVGGLSTDLFKGLPDIWPLQVCLEVFDGDTNTAGNHVVRLVLQKILSQYVLMEMLTIPLRYQYIWEKLVSDLVEQGESAFPVVTFVRS